MASVVVTMDSREAKLFQALDKLIQKQNQVNSKFEDGGKKSKSASDTAAAAIRKLALQYVSIQGAMQVINSLSAEYARLQEASVQATQKLSAAQTDSIKNLQGLTYLQKQSLMTTDVSGIQRRTGFPNREMLSDAIGAGVSAGGSVEEVLSAVEAAARLNVNTPDKMQTAAAGAIDLARATGIRDAEKNLGFLLTTGAVSRVESSDKLANALAKSLGSAMKTVPGQDAEQAAKESAALFATLNKQANDKQGDATATALITLTAYIRKIAGDRSDTLSGRIKAIQGDAGLREEFLKNLPGEAAFKLPFERLVTQGSEVFSEFDNNASAVAFSTQAFRENAEQLQKMTSELAFGAAGAAITGATQAFDVSPSAQAKAQLGKIADEVLPRVRPGGVPMITTAASDMIAQPIIDFMYQDPDLYATHLRDSLQSRRRSLEIGGVTPDEQVKIDLIDQTLKTIERILVELARASVRMSQSADVMARNQNPARAQAAGASQ